MVTRSIAATSAKGAKHIFVKIVVMKLFNIKTTTEIIFVR